MKRKRNLRLAPFGCAALLIGGVWLSVSADSFKSLPGIPNGVSPDGKIIVGNKMSYDDNSQFISFVYTAENGECVWVTEYDENRLHKSGLFKAVTNSGIKAGAIKNPTLRLPEEGGGGDFFRPKKIASSTEKGPAITSAAVWRDGKTHVLDMGRWTEADFLDSFDGSYATGVTEDGAVVVGYIRVGWYNQTPCYWYWDEETEKYVFGEFPLGVNCPVGQPYGFSPETAVLVGEVSYMESQEEGATVTANIWEGPEQTKMLTLPTLESPFYSTIASAISNNGRYVGVVGSGAIFYAGVYDRQNDSYIRIPVNPEAIQVSVLALTDDGSAFVRYNLNGDWALYYFDYKSGTFVDIKYYLQDVAPGLEKNVSNTSIITAVTGDGKTLIGRNGESGWVINIDNPQLLTIQPPAEIRFVHSSPTEVVLTWNGVETIQEGTVLKGYKARIDEEEKFFPATEKGGDFEWKIKDVTGTSHGAFVHTVFEKKGEEFLSPRSEMLSVYASSDTDKKMLETFDDASQFGNMDFVLNNDYWTVEGDGEGINEVIKWHLTLDDFDNRSLCMQMYGVSTYPWSCRLVSRFFESEDKDVNFSMRYKRRAVSSAGQDFALDWLDIEMTTDGQNWTPIKRINGNEAKEGAWETVYVQVPKTDNPFWRLRINAKGSGLTHLMWLVDDVCVNQEESDETATGLRVLRQDTKEGLTLGWHNELGLHQLSYLENSPIVWDYNVGNEGKPMLVGVDFNSKMTAPFSGEYIHGISSFLFDDPDLTGDNPTHAEGILYEDDKEVARAPIYSEFQDVTSSVAWFSTPVKIQEGKTYRAAVRISDYPEEQAPIYYQAGLSMVPGVTDLYSEDEGKTWLKASEILADEIGRGNVIWPIRVLIAPEFELGEHEEDFQDWVMYNVVYRNGEPLDGVNYYEPHPFVVDPNPRPEAEYSLRTYFTNREASKLSEPLKVKFTGIEEIFEILEGSFTIDRASEIISVDGNVEKAYITSLDGRNVAQTTTGKLSYRGLKGIHILTLSTAKGNKAYKVVL